MITHLEPDIMECEVKWALESITMNIASRGDEIPVQLFQILKDDAVKVLHSICQQLCAYSVEGWPLKAGRGDRSLGMGLKGCSCLFMADSS